MALQTFTAGQILTAAQVTALQANDYNQTVSAKTGSYVLTAADKGTRITMSSASATTITVNTSLFAAGDSLRIQNLNGGGTCTVTAGTATVTSAGSLIIPSWGGGQLYFTSTSAAVWFPDAVTSTPGGLTLIKTQTIGSAVSSVAVTGAFNATYENYKITVNGGAGSGSVNLNLVLGSTTTGYYWAAAGNSYAGSSAYGNLANTSSIWVGTAFPNGNTANIEIFSPQIAARTTYSAPIVRPSTTGGMFSAAGFLDNATQYTDFTLSPDSGTLTGGTIRVYGYSNS